MVTLINWTNDVQQCLDVGQDIRTKEIQEKCTRNTEKLIELLRGELSLKNRLILRKILE